MRPAISRPSKARRPHHSFPGARAHLDAAPFQIRRARLSKKQVAPHQDTHELIHSWLEHHGIASSSISRTHDGGWLTITSVPVSQADELLCVVPDLQARRDERDGDHSSDCGLLASCCTTRACANDCTNDSLRFPALATADSEKAS